MTSPINYAIKYSKTGIPTKQLPLSEATLPSLWKLIPSLMKYPSGPKKGHKTPKKTAKEIAGQLKARKINQTFEETRTAA